MVVAFDVPRPKVPAEEVSRREAAAIKRFPEFKVVLEPSSEKRASPIDTDDVNFTNLLVVPKPVILEGGVTYGRIMAEIHAALSLPSEAQDQLNEFEDAALILLLLSTNLPVNTLPVTG
ncbi:hypothetical protein KW784_00090 [Candidatus Parcubacteria bacterium]|nr:hypothetical protein [Candidatus Parcubacteria bacterium]